MKFDPTKYETVKQRKKRFYADYPDGRIVVDSATPEKHFEDYSLFRATIYLNRQDQLENLSKSTGYALEVREHDLSKNKYGKLYESVNYSSWTENAEESAIGRALDNAGYSGNDKCSLDEMMKAKKHNTQFKNKIENGQVITEEIPETHMPKPRTEKEQLQKFYSDIATAFSHLQRKAPKIFGDGDLELLIETELGISNITDCKDLSSLKHFLEHLRKLYREA